MRIYKERISVMIDDDLDIDLDDFVDDLDDNINGNNHPKTKRSKNTKSKKTIRFRSKNSIVYHYHKIKILYCGVDRECNMFFIITNNNPYKLFLLRKAYIYTQEYEKESHKIDIIFPAVNVIGNDKYYIINPGQKFMFYISTTSKPLNNLNLSLCIIWRKEIDSFDNEIKLYIRQDLVTSEEIIANTFHII